MVLQLKVSIVMNFDMPLLGKKFNKIIFRDFHLIRRLIVLRLKSLDLEKLSTFLECAEGTPPTSPAKSQLPSGRSSFLSSLKFGSSERSVCNDISRATTTETIWDEDAFILSNAVSTDSCDSLFSMHSKSNNSSLDVHPFDLKVFPGTSETFHDPTPHFHFQQPTLPLVDDTHAKLNAKIAAFGFQSLSSVSSEAMQSNLQPQAKSFVPNSASAPFTPRSTSASLSSPGIAFSSDSAYSNSSPAVSALYGISAPSMFIATPRSSPRVIKASERPAQIPLPPLQRRSPAPAVASGPPMRQLPCKTWLSTGSCPYSTRCVFLHDPRCISASVQYNCKRKSREDPTTDGLFWPTLTREAVSGQLDRRGQPKIDQQYIVPSPLQKDLIALCMQPPPAILAQHFERHQWCTYSTWQHFLDFLTTDDLSIVQEDRIVSSLTYESSVVENQHTHRPRLDVFIGLACSETYDEAKEVATDTSFMSALNSFLDTDLVLLDTDPNQPWTLHDDHSRLMSLEGMSHGHDPLTPRLAALAPDLSFGLRLGLSSTPRGSMHSTSHHHPSSYSYWKN